MKSPKKSPPLLPEGAFKLWATKLAEIISTRSGVAVPAELQALIDKLKNGKLSEQAFQKQVKDLREKLSK